MFHDSPAASVPLIMGTSDSRPEKVAPWGSGAIVDDRAEVSVAPLRQRLRSRPRPANAPELSGRIAGSKAAEVADGIAAGQTDKR